MQFLHGLRKLLMFLFHLLTLYLLIAIVGMFWARNLNNNSNQSGVPIIVHGNGFHTELYLPIEDSFVHYNWLKFVNNDLITSKHRGKKFITMGWADKDWSVAGALGKVHVLMAFESVFWPWNSSIMHVQFMDTVHRLTKPFTEKRYLSAEEYENLIFFIRKSFVSKNGIPVIISPGYDDYDYFFASERHYNAFNTCNQWTADALNSCAVRNPRFAPFGWSIAYQLKK